MPAGGPNRAMTFRTRAQAIRRALANRCRRFWSRTMGFRPDGAKLGDEPGADGVVGFGIGGVRALVAENAGKAGLGRGWHRTARGHCARAARARRQNSDLAAMAASRQRMAAKARNVSRRIRPPLVPRRGEPYRFARSLR